MRWTTFNGALMVCVVVLLTVMGCSDTTSNAPLTNVGVEKIDGGIQGAGIKKRDVVLVYDAANKRLKPDNFLVCEGDRVIVIMPEYAACMYPMCGGAFVATLSGVAPKSVEVAEGKILKHFMDYTEDQCQVLYFDGDELPASSDKNEFVVKFEGLTVAEDRTYDYEIIDYPRDHEPLKSSEATVFLNVKTGEFFPNGILIGMNEEIAVQWFMASDAATKIVFHEFGHGFLGSEETHAKTYTIPTWWGVKQHIQLHFMDYTEDSPMFMVSHHSASDFVQNQKNNCKITIDGTVHTFPAKYRRVVGDRYEITFDDDWVWNQTPQ